MGLQKPEPDPLNGGWMYPESWTPADREEWEGIVGEQAHHEKREAAAVEAGAKALASPEIAKAARRADVAAAKAKADFAERKAKGEVAWVQARAQFGDRVARLDGEDGDVFIMGTPTTEQVLAANRRSDELIRNAHKDLKPNASEEERTRVEIRAFAESVGAQLDALLDYTAIGGLEADASRARIRTLCAQYAGLRPMLFGLRDSLIRGWRDAEGKGSAPF
jgi:hypothetical protein